MAVLAMGVPWVAAKARIEGPLGLLLLFVFLPLLAKHKPIAPILGNMFSARSRAWKTAKTTLGAVAVGHAIAQQFVFDMIRHQEWLGPLRTATSWLPGDPNDAVAMGLGVLCALPWIFCAARDDQGAGGPPVVQAAVALVVTAGGIFALSVGISHGIDGVLQGSQRRWLEPGLATGLTMAGWLVLLVGDHLIRAPKQDTQPHFPAAMGLVGSFLVGAFVGAAVRAASRPLAARIADVPLLLGDDGLPGLPEMGWMVVASYVLGLIVSVITLSWMAPPIFNRRFAVSKCANPTTGHADWSEFADAYTNRVANAGPGPMFIVAAHGGGIQAQIWATSALRRVGFGDQGLVDLGPKDQGDRDLQERFWPRVAMVTGTSGGAVGLAHILWRLAAFKRAPGAISRAPDGASDAARAGYLDQVAHSVLLFWRDRGGELVKVWRDQCRGDLRAGDVQEPDVSLRDGLRSSVAAGKLPAPIFAATVLESGLPFTMAPFRVPPPSTSRTPWSACRAARPRAC
jgi:hypothetical protein